MPSVFPHGMSFIQEKLGVPMVMHNRQWSSKSDYIKNEDFDWYESKCCAVPKEQADIRHSIRQLQIFKKKLLQDPAKFFNWFFTQQKGWGLTMYEQDWMNKEYDGVDALQVRSASCL